MTKARVSLAVKGSKGSKSVGMRCGGAGATYRTKNLRVLLHKKVPDKIPAFRKFPELSKTPMLNGRVFKDMARKRHGAQETRQARDMASKRHGAQDTGSRLADQLDLQAGHDRNPIWMGNVLKDAVQSRCRCPGCPDIDPSFIPPVDRSLPIPAPGCAYRLAPFPALAYTDP